MNVTENKKHIEIAPAVGIGIILVLVALAGLLFYKGLLLTQQERSETAVTVDTSVITDTSTEQQPLTEGEELVQIEQQLEEVTAEVSNNDLFGLDELDAELIDFSELDEIFNFEI